VTHAFVSCALDSAFARRTKFKDRWLSHFTSRSSKARTNSPIVVHITPTLKMEAQVAQVVQAIAIASDPARGPLHQQALDFLKNVQDNAATAWRLALAIFVETASDGVRKHPLQARFWALRVLDEFFDNRCVRTLSSHGVDFSENLILLFFSFDLLDMETFTTVQQAFVGYIQTEYVTGPAESGAPCTSPPIRFLSCLSVLDQFFATSFRIHSHYFSSAPTRTNGHLSSRTSLP
jgi:hypothetical protein